MVVISRRRGTLLTACLPLARSVAARSGSAAFLAPLTNTSPCSGLPPLMVIRSIIKILSPSMIDPALYNTAGTECYSSPNCFILRYRDVLPIFKRFAACALFCCVACNACIIISFSACCLPVRSTGAASHAFLNQGLQPVYLFIQFNLFLEKVVEFPDAEISYFSVCSHDF